jgi:hypothetical protein
MFDWLKKKATEKQEANFRTSLTRLISEANEVNAALEFVGNASSEQRERIKDRFSREGGSDAQEDAVINRHPQGPRWRALWHEQALYRMSCMRQRPRPAKRAKAKKK